MSLLIFAVGRVVLGFGVGARDLILDWVEFELLYVMLLVELVDFRIRLDSIQIIYRVWVAGRSAVAIKMGEKTISG